MNKHLLLNTFTFDILFTISFKNIYSGKHLYKSVKFHFMFILNYYQIYIFKRQLEMQWGRMGVGF